MKFRPSRAVTTAVSATALTFVAVVSSPLAQAVPGGEAPAAPRIEAPALPPVPALPPGVDAGSLGALNAGNAAGMPKPQTDPPAPGASAPATAKPAPQSPEKPRDVAAHPGANTPVKTAGTTGMINAEALGKVRPRTLAAVGVAGSAVLGSVALSLGPEGSATGSALLGEVLPGVSFVPSGSLGGGTFVTSVGMEIPARTVAQSVLGFGSSALTGYLESMAAKQDAGKFTEGDIALWSDILDSVDELRAVANQPPLPRSNPHDQKPLPEPCRRGYPKQAKVSKEEADKLCEAAKAAEAGGQK